MQKKVLYIVLGVVLVLALGGIGYATMHKTSKASTSNAYGSTTPSNSASTNTSTGAVVQTKTASNVGPYLADSSGYALYTYGADTNGVSNCSGSCLAAWPAYAPTDTAATLPTGVTVITRADSSKQYAYKGSPLYTFTSDSVGQVTGNGVANFTVAKP